MTTPRKSTHKGGSRSTGAKAETARTVDTVTAGLPEAVSSTAEEGVNLAAEGAVAAPDGLLVDDISPSGDLEAVVLSEASPVVEEGDPGASVEAPDAPPGAADVALAASEGPAAEEPVTILLVQDEDPEEGAAATGEAVVEAVSASALVLVERGHAVSARTLAYVDGLTGAALSYHKALLDCADPAAVLQLHLASLEQVVDQSVSVGVDVLGLVGATLGDAWAPLAATWPLGATSADAA